MSEQEKTSGEATNRGSPIAVLETPSSKYSVPYKPSEKLEEVAVDVHEKQAPALTCTHTLLALTENWKDSAENQAIKELKESENAMSSERHKNVAKKLSSQVSSMKHSAVAIPMTPIETESKTGELKMLPTTAWKGKPSITPIPDIEKKKEEVERKDDDDSITSEITELRTPEVVKKTPEWFTENAETIAQTSNSEVFKNREISWHDEEYTSKVQLQNLCQRSSSWMLERKPSIGPCNRGNMPVTASSGITISIPKKSLRDVNVTAIESNSDVVSGIRITKSKRCLVNKTKTNGPEMNNDVELKIKEDSTSYGSNVKEKLDNFFGRIIHAFHI